MNKTGLEVIRAIHSTLATSHQLQKAWPEKLGSVRKNSALDLLLSKMVGIPVFTIATASGATSRVISSVASAVERCIDVSIIKAMDSQRHNHIFEVPEVINDFNIFERNLPIQLVILK
jgi:hypothetical protein